MSRADCPICGDRANQRFVMGDLMLDRRTCSVMWHGQRVHVPGQRFQILALLMADPGRVWSREQIINEMDPYGISGLSVNTFGQHLHRLRLDLAGIAVIRNKRSLGNWLEPAQVGS